MIRFSLKECAVRVSLALLLAMTSLIAATPPRTVGSQALLGYVPKEAASLVATGRLPGTQHLSLAIGLPLRNQAALTELLHEITDPSSPNYRHYLTPAQFTEEFGPTKKDFEAVAAFAEKNGLKVTVRHPNRLILDVEGAVSDIERTLHVRLLTYKHPTEARDFFAPDVEPSVDLTVPIGHIEGLSNYSMPRPGVLPARASLGAKPSAGSAPSGNYAGADFRAAYAPGVTLNGSGQNVGLVQFDGYYASDITAYETEFSLPHVNLVNVSVDGGVTPPFSGNGNEECSLDIEMVISMAPGVSAIYVYESGGYYDDTLSRMATDNICKEISTSWYGGPNPDSTADNIFQEFAAQGQSFFTASGDFGAYGSTISFPEDNPHITSVGGTNLSTTGPGGTYVSETVWPGSSGGISPNYSIPYWQQPVSMANNQGSTTQRNVPDVALIANNVWITYGNGSATAVGGTSIAAPLWAGFTALVNEQAAAQGKPTVGFLNPAIYSIGSAANYAEAFHDITSGNNETTNSPNEFSAATGYDLCTGWGSPAGANLMNALLDYAGPVFVDFNYTGSVQNGQYATPYSTLTAGVNNVASGGSIFIRTGGASHETLTITKPMVITASDGAAVIGH